MEAFALNEVEARVLGSLVEKAIATPDYYPLTLNALVNACNQSSNREPVMNLDEPAVLSALERLRQHRLAYVSHGAESRVAKYGHNLAEALDLTPAQTAVLCVLLLRGPQTVGEIRSRTGRLYEFESLAEAEDTLAELAAKAPRACVVKLPRQIGFKESRYAHLLSGEAQASTPVESVASSDQTPRPSQDSERLEKLEAEAATLRQQIADLQQRFAEFQRQFE